MDGSLSDLFGLTGKVAIVTGASRGLGVTFARGLARAGADVVLAARNEEGLKQTAGELERHGRRVLSIVTDVTVAEEVESLANEVVDTFGKIDVLVNNAGVAAVAPAEEMTYEQWQGVLDTNVTGVFRCAQSVGRHMLTQGSGKIINIASAYGIVGSSYVSQVSYVTSKSAVLGLTRELAVEWAPRGVKVVTLAPGFFRSDQTVWAFEGNPDLGKRLLAKVPMGRLGDLPELEAAIVYLASTASDYMTGQALVLDGGLSIW